jgi:hypothetical protein
MARVVRRSPRWFVAQADEQRPIGQAVDREIFAKRLDRLWVKADRLGIVTPLALDECDAAAEVEVAHVEANDFDLAQPLEREQAEQRLEPGCRRRGWQLPESGGQPGDFLLAQPIPLVALPLLEALDPGRHIRGEGTAAV